MRFVCFFAFLLALAPLRAEPTSSPDINRASKIITIDQASEVLGARAEPSLRNHLPDSQSGRSWTSTASWSTTGGLNPRTISLFLRHGESARETGAAFAASREVLQGDPVANLGDAAFRTGSPAQLNVRKGADWLIITAGNLVTPDPALQEKAARLILMQLAK